MKTVKASTFSDLINEIYKRENWSHLRGENKAKRVMEIYGIAVDYETNKYVATKGGK